MPFIAEDIGLDYFYGPEGPTLKQADFRDALETYKLFGGGVGGGKTVALCAEALRLSLMYKGNRGFIARHEAEAFRKTTLVTFLTVVGQVEAITKERIIASHNQSKKEFILINGSVIMYGGLGGPEDMDRIKSLEIGWFAVDEASESNFEVVKMLKARLRWKLPNGTYPRKFGLFASNPEPGWLKDTFVTPQQQGEPLPDHIFIQALVRDNPHLPPTYEAELRRDNPEDWVKRYLDGNWDAVEGQIWKEFSFNIHVFPNPDFPSIEIPMMKDVNPSLVKLAGLDHGQSKPTAFLAGFLDQDENIIISEEYYSPGLVSEHAKAVNSRFGGIEFDYVAADPSIWSKNREKDGDVWSVADEYEEYDLPLLKGVNDVLAGINRVAEYLKVDQSHAHPFLDKMGSPRVFISARCKNLIKELPEYMWKHREEEEGKKEEPRKYKDHACDALRYLIMTRPSPNEDKKKELKPYTFDWYMSRQQGVREEKEGYITNG